MSITVVTSTSPQTSTEPRKPRSKISNLLVRILSLMATALIVGAVVHLVESRLEDKDQPAGFVRGVVQGALMPMAMPNLLVGNDVAIYAEKNTGRPYKLGYTVGVNVCGLLFFGVFFLRVTRWRKT